MGKSDRSSSLTILALVAVLAGGCGGSSDPTKADDVPPTSPASPSPVDGISIHAIAAELSWTCSDPDGDNLTFDVYLGTTNPPATRVSTRQTGQSYIASALTAPATYYWRVVAIGSGNDTAGPVWSFNTANDAPTSPANPTPSDGGTGISRNVALSWNSEDADGDAMTFDVY